MRVRIRRFNEAEQVRPTDSLSSIPLRLSTKRSSCRLHLRSSWPCATDLCDFSRVRRHGVAGCPTQLARGDVCVPDANASRSNSVCDAVSTAPNLRTVSTAMPFPGFGENTMTSQLRVRLVLRTRPKLFHSLIAEGDHRAA